MPIKFSPLGFTQNRKWIDAWMDERTRDDDDEDR